MISGRLLGLSAAALLLAAIFACGSDDGGGGTSPTDDAGGDASNVDGGDNDGSLPPPTPAEFGLDARPANPTCKPPARPPNTAPVKFERVFSGTTLSLPMQIAQIPGDATRWFVAQRSGALVSFPTAAPSTPSTVASLAALSGRSVVTNGEGGFLGLAFHPKFAQNGKLFVSWTSNGQGSGSMLSTIGVLTSPDNGASFTSYADILTFDQSSATNHKGGGIAFGNDGYLYVSFGDGGSADDAFVHGQYTDTFFAKLLRLDVDNPAGGKAYGIPPTNPFVAGGGLPEIFAYGLRNPFRFSVDRATGEVWVGDVGQNQYEEIDAKIKPGANYGWPCREGAHDYLTANATKCPNPNAPFTEPLIEQQHVAPSAARAIIGGFVYRGKAIPGFVGNYVFGDNSRLELWGVSFDPLTGAPTTTQLNAGAPPALTWVSFAEDQDGELYAVALVEGQIWKMVPGDNPQADSFPALLSQTGCVDPKDPKKPASGVIPYGVNAALWSDGAKKDRFMALPDGKTITVGADGDFDFPNGTVLMKSFAVGGKLVETRLFMRHDDGGWAGYTYEWNDAQTDATLLRSSKSKPVGTQSWYYPSRSECVTCHSEAAGRSLGLELGQQNGDFVYPSTNRISNQLKTLDHIGMFAAPLGKPVSDIVAYPDPVGTGGSLEGRARAYLHSNCSNCHRPQGPGGGDMDFRFATALKDTKTCDVDPQRGDLGVAGLKLLTPGQPTKSAISLRPHSPVVNRMPPLASSVVDDKGVKVLDDWITSVTACPQ